jgi:hypothetical protein
MKASTIRMCGIAVALGAIIWSVSWLQAGVLPVGPDGQPINDQVEIWAGGIYLLGLLALLLAMRATFATGSGRLGRWALKTEIGFVILAIAWNIPYAFDANRQPSLVLMVLDAFWPLAMLGKIVIGVLVIRARCWPAPVRYLPLAASMLFPIYIATSLAGLSEWTQIIVRATYFAVAHTLLGLAVIRQIAPLMGRMTASRGAYFAPESR